jgi:hypothetical protein
VLVNILIQLVDSPAAGAGYDETALVAEIAVCFEYFARR